MVQGDGEHERPRLRIAEIFRSLNWIGGSSAARLWVVASPLRPRIEISAGDSHVDTAEPERALNPGCVQRIGNRELAEFHVPVLLETGLLDSRERAGRVALAIPILTDRNGFSRARSDHRAVEPAALAEDLRVAGALLDCVFRIGRSRSRNLDAVCPLLSVLMRAIAPEGALHVVRHHPAVPD